MKGVVTGVRFYKSPGNTGAHVGSLWNANGVELATGTFTNESASGWQTAELRHAGPDRQEHALRGVVPLHDGALLRHPNAFSERDLSWAPLRVRLDGGCLHLRAPASRAAQSSTNYMVDVVFDKTPPSISMTSQSPAPGALDVPRSNKVVVDLSDQVEPGWSLSVGSGRRPSRARPSSRRDRHRITWTPSAPMPAGADVTVDPRGRHDRRRRRPGHADLDVPHPLRRRRCRTRRSSVTSCPTRPAADDGAPMELGMAFTPSRNGTVKAIRFFKGVGNNGTHTGSIWSAAGIAARHRDLRQRDGHRLADRRRWRTPLAGDRGHDLRRLLLRSAGPLLGDVRVLQQPAARRAT